MATAWKRIRPGTYSNGKRGIIVRIPAKPKPYWSVAWDSMFGREHRDVATLAEAKRLPSRGY